MRSPIQTNRPGPLRPRLLAALLPVWLLPVWLLTVGGCASEPTLEFPVYQPTAPFLAEQERTRERADAVRALRGRERVRNVIRFRDKTLAAWEPIYARVQAAEAVRAVEAEKKRKREAFKKRLQEARR